MSKTAIVVPCYNEAERLETHRFLEFIKRNSVRIIFVNDGSSDATAAVLEQLCDSSPELFSRHELPQNRGKAEAVRQGFQQALLENPDYIGFWDADLATPLDDIPTFLRLLDRRPEITIAIGSRIPLLGRKIERKRGRQILGRLFARVASVALATRCYDTQCGAKLFRVTPAVRRAFSTSFRTKWIFDVEIMGRLAYASRCDGTPALSESIYEVPLDHWEDVAGSKLKSGDFVKAIGELANIYWSYLRPGLPLMPTERTLQNASTNGKEMHRTPLPFDPDAVEDAAQDSPDQRAA